MSFVLTEVESIAVLWYLHSMKTNQELYFNEDGSFKKWSEIHPPAHKPDDWQVKTLEGVRQRIGDEDFKTILMEVNGVLQGPLGGLQMEILNAGGYTPEVEARYQRVCANLHTLHPDIFIEWFGPVAK